MKIKDRIELLTLLALGAFVLTWPHGPGIILSVDSFFVMRPELAVREALSAWSRLYTSGSPNFMPQTLPFYAILWGLQSAIGLRAAELIVLAALVASSALSMRYLLRFYFRDRSLAATAAVIACSAVYCSNPFTISYVWWRQTWLEFTWAAFPFCLGLLLRGMDRQLSLRLSAAAGSIVLLFCAPGFTHVLLVPLGLFTVALVFTQAASSQDRLDQVKRAATILGAWAVALGWWIVPSLLFLRGFMAQWHALYGSDPKVLLAYASQFSTLDNVVRFLGEIQLGIYSGVTPLFTWYAAVQHTWISWVFYTLPLAALLGFLVWLFRRNSSDALRHAPFYAAVFAIGIFLIKGSAPPLAFINEALLKLPLGAAWQHPYDKFAQVSVIAATVLAAAGLLVTFRAVQSRAPERASRALIVCLSAIFIGAEGWPFFSGQILTQDHGIIPGAVIVVPADYDRLETEFHGVHGMTLQLPLRDDGETAFAWTRGAQTNNDPLLENYNGAQPVIRMRNGDLYADRLVEMARSEVSSDTSRSPLVLSMLGIGAVVVHHDWAQEYIPVPDVAAQERTLRHSAGMASRNSYRYIAAGRLHVFRTPCPTPFIYSASEVFTVAEGPSILNALRTHASCARRVAVVQNMHVSAPIADPGLKVVGASPSRYDITIPRGGSYVLVMNTTFSTHWRAYSRNGSSTVIAHAPANGYANAFLVRSSGPDVIELKFDLQPLVDWTLVCGLALTLISIGALGLSLNYRTQQRHSKIQETA